MSRSSTLLSLSFWRTDKHLVMLFVLLFTYSAAGKMIELDEFSDKLLLSPLIGINYINLVVYTVPLGELLIVILLFFPKSRLIGKYLSFFTMTLFTMYLIVLNNIDGFIPCSCGGIFEKLTFTEHLVANTILWSLSTLSVFLNSSDPKLVEFNASPNT